MQISKPQHVYMSVCLYACMYESNIHIPLLAAGVQISTPQLTGEWQVSVLRKHGFQKDDELLCC